MSKFNSVFIFLVILFIFIYIQAYNVNAAPDTYKIVYEIQKKLLALGYNPGPIDGLWGKRTQAAIRQFQRDQGLPATGSLDNATKEQLSFSEDSSLYRRLDNQLTPSDTAGRCLESSYLFKEYQKNENQFKENFDDIPLCVSGYTESLGEKPDYFYINITDKNLEKIEMATSLNIQCRIEKLNETHRRILKESLSINSKEEIRVKGIYKASIGKLEETLVLDQCYLVKKIADGSN